MKKKVILLVIPTILVGLLGLFSFSLFDSKIDVPADQERDDLIKDLLFKSLGQYHYNPLEIDNDFSSRAFDLYIKELDNTKRYLLKEDIKKLSPYKANIDDEIKGGENPLYGISVEILEKRRAEVQEYIYAILDKPFDFSKEEFIELDAEKRDFYKSKKELKEEWRKYLKYQALVRYRAKIKEQNEKESENGEESAEKVMKSEAEIEKEVREQIVKSYKNYFDILSKEDHDDHLADYFNAVMSVYDPHTEYYPPEDKEDFDIRFSGRLEGIGATLAPSDGEIKVNSIVPGSASWKQKELKEGDAILKVGQAEEDPVSIVGWAVKDAVKLIRGPKGTEVRLTVRKPDGLIKVIPIIRDIVIIEESYAKSAIINDKETGKKIGIIHLPAFYADFSGKGGRNSADDVKQELMKLKFQEVDGVVLDLRNNGGGSLRDAVDMAGLFIDKGPIVQIKSKDKKAEILEDKDADVFYDGPLAIMVNKFSASASEILAAAMQDYGRAVVMGSPTTHGKGTVQRFVDLDYFIRSGGDNLKPLGSLKLTIQKFYRITGKSTQFRGVTPDIIIPDTYAYMPYGEQDLDNALPWDEIEPAGFKPYEKSFPLAEIVSASEKRVANNEVFALVEQNAKRLKTQRDETYQSVNYDAYNAKQDELSRESKKYEDLSKEHEDIEVKGLEFDINNEELGEIKKKSMQDWYGQLAKDVYVYEATRVVNQLIEKW